MSVSDNASQKPRIVKAEHRSGPSQTSVNVTNAAPFSLIQCDECDRQGAIFANGQIHTRPHHDGAKHRAHGEVDVVLKRLWSHVSMATLERAVRDIEAEFARRDKVADKRVA
jgi:hypothetical protein